MSNSEPWWPFKLGKDERRFIAMENGAVVFVAIEEEIIWPEGETISSTLVTAQRHVGAPVEHRQFKDELELRCWLINLSKEEPTP